MLVKGREITLKLGGGGAQGNSGNYGGLDLDTTNGSGACHGDTSGIPNAAEEVQYGACTPYSIGDPVNTQTGNFAGQVNNGLSARIGNSPDNWTTAANPPPPGDPRWMSLILVPPITFSNCNGNCTTQVVGFGSFYITDYSGQQGSDPQAGRGARRLLGPARADQSIHDHMQRPRGHLPCIRCADALGRLKPFHTLKGLI